MKHAIISHDPSVCQPISCCDVTEIKNGQKSGGGTLLLMSKKFNLRIREDLNFLRPSHFVVICVEFSPIFSKQSKKHVIIFAYSPHKQFEQLFLEDTLKGIDYVAWEGRF